MRLTYGARTALQILRQLRRGGIPAFRLRGSIDLIPPDPSPRVRWTRKLLVEEGYALARPSSDGQILDIESDSTANRIRTKNVRSVQHECASTLPPRSFTDLGDGFAMCCPELMLAELAEIMPPVEHLMLINELCGSFARDPLDPVNGDVVYNLEPVTSVEKIRTFLSETRWLRGAKPSLEALETVSGGAWSPKESLVAALMGLPLYDCGYGLGPCVLNRRIYTPAELATATSAKSRVPDILIEGTPVGINYDGVVHLDLDSIANAAVELGSNPGASAPQVALDRAMRDVRAKVVDDIRRNRELMADGYVVFPVTKEDLYEEGGLDRVMLQVISAVEQFSSRDMSEHRHVMGLKRSRKKRQKMIWSLMSGKTATRNAMRLEAELSPGVSGVSMHEIHLGF